jgi:protein TonB
VSIENARRKEEAVLPVAVVVAVLATPFPATAGGEPPVPPVDLRQILVGGSLDPDKAARAGLDVSQMQPPKLKKQVAPVYPASSVRSGRVVEVVTECRIDTGGVPRDCHITRSGDSFLSEAALDAIKKWRYEPLRVRGVPTPALVAITIRFDPSSK